MMKRLIQFLSVGGAGIILFFLFGAAPVFAAGQCCMYGIANNAPKWLQDLDDMSGASIFYDLKSGETNCPSIGSVVSLAPYAKTDFFASGIVLTAQQCSDTGDSSMKAPVEEANKQIQCCIVSTADNKPFACIDKKVGDSSNCLETAHSSLDTTRTLVASTAACNTLDPCKALAAAATSGSAPATTPAAASSTNALGQETPPWTAAECTGMKNNDGTPRNWWIPPPNNPTVTTGDYCYARPIRTDLEVPLGDQASVIHSIPEYINSAYKYAIGIAVLAAVLMLMYAGFVWMLSGVASQINQAKTMMLSAATGLVLIFGAFVLLNTINPQLTQLQAPPIHAIRPDVFVGGQAANSCDPQVENSCASQGQNMRCEPTILGIQKSCDKNMEIFTGSVFGLATVVAAAPFAIAAATAAITDFTATVAEQGVAQYAKGVAVRAITKKFTVGGAVTYEAGKTFVKKVGEPLLLAAGIVYLLPSDSTGLGYCVPMNHDKVDGEICNGDADCVSSKCLFTSTSACGVQKFGICVSGQLGEACALQDNSLFGDKIQSTGALKYGCQGSVVCVDNGHGPSKASMNIGFCSDGSRVGLPCSSKVTCSTANKLECDGGYCRQAGFFDSEGSMIKGGAVPGQPLCILPSDCAIGGSGVKGQLTQYVGCLKSPVAELGLPARFLVPVTNFKPDQQYFGEFNSFGTCSIADYKFINNGGATTNNICYVNVYNGDEFNSSAMDDALTTINSELGKKLVPDSMDSIFQKTKISIGKVGCGYNGDVVSSLQNNTDLIGKGTCEVTLTSLGKESLKIINTPDGQVGVAQGTCVPFTLSNNAFKDAFVAMDKGNEMLLVQRDDPYYSWVKTPDMTSLESTFAGSVTQ